MLIAATVALIGLILSMRSVMPESGDSGSRIPTAAKDLTVTIGTETFDLQNGLAEKPAAPGSAAMNTVRIVGDPVTGDVDGDGRPDAALLIENDPGGSGTFYYAVVAVNHGEGGLRASNALPLGDRIAPEGIEFDDGRFVYRFRERNPGESMAATPTLEKRVPVTVDAESDRIVAGS